MKKLMNIADIAATSPHLPHTVLQGQSSGHALSQMKAGIDSTVQPNFREVSKVPNNLCCLGNY
jgi:hypothetical protein